MLVHLQRCISLVQCIGSAHVHGAAQHEFSWESVPGSRLNAA